MRPALEPAVLVLLVEGTTFPSSSMQTLTRRRGVQVLTPRAVPRIQNSSTTSTLHNQQITSGLHQTTSTTATTPHTSPLATPIWQPSCPRYWPAICFILREPLSSSYMTRERMFDAQQEAWTASTPHGPDRQRRRRSHRANPTPTIRIFIQLKTTGNCRQLPRTTRMRH